MDSKGIYARNSGLADRSVTRRQSMAHYSMPASARPSSVSELRVGRRALRFSSNRSWMRPNRTRQSGEHAGAACLPDPLAHAISVLPYLDGIRPFPQSQRCSSLLVSIDELLIGPCISPSSLQSLHGAHPVLMTEQITVCAMKCPGVGCRFLNWNRADT